MRDCQRKKLQMENICFLFWVLFLELRFQISSGLYFYCVAWTSEKSERLWAYTTVDTLNNDFEKNVRTEMSKTIMAKKNKSRNILDTVWKKPTI